MHDRPEGLVTAREQHMGFDTLRDALDQEQSFAGAWSYREGSKSKAKGDGALLIGTIQRVNVREPDDRDPYPVVTVVAEEGSTQHDGEELEVGTPYAFHAEPTTAKRGLREAIPGGVQAGDRIAIRYDGWKKGKKNAYYGFTIRAERPDGLREGVGSEPAPWE